MGDDSKISNETLTLRYPTQDSPHTYTMYPIIIADACGMCCTVCIRCTYLGAVIYQVSSTVLTFNDAF